MAWRISETINNAVMATVCLVAFIDGVCIGEDEIVFKNGFSRDMFLFIYPKEQERWERPERLLIRNGQPVSVPINAASKHYVGLRDKENRWRPLGWYPLQKYANKGYGIRLKGMVVERQGFRTVTRTVKDTREQSYTVNVPYTETLTGTRIVVRNGKTYREPYTYEVTKVRQEQRTRTVHVARQVQEQVPYTYQLELPKLELTGASQSEIPAPVTSDESGANPVDDRNRRLPMSVHACRIGIHVDAIPSNSVAQRIRGRQGQSLESGDHVIAVNGTPVMLLEEFDDAIAKSPPDFSLGVLDVRTGQRVEFTGELPP